jgi:sec-independent protein translocase protein TatA
MSVGASRWLARTKGSPRFIVGAPPVRPYVPIMFYYNHMGPIGIQELVLIVVIALIVFGPRRLPELGRTVGKTLAEFRRASNEIKESIQKELDEEDQKSRES